MPPRVKVIPGLTSSARNGGSTSPNGDRCTRNREPLSVSGRHGTIECVDGRQEPGSVDAQCRESVRQAADRVRGDVRGPRGHGVGEGLTDARRRPAGQRHIVVDPPIHDQPRPTLRLTDDLEWRPSRRPSIGSRRRTVRRASSRGSRPACSTGSPKPTWPPGRPPADPASCARRRSTWMSSTCRRPRSRRAARHRCFVGSRAGASSRAYGPTWCARSSALPPKPPVAMISDRARIVVRPPPASTTQAETSPSASTATDSSAVSVLTRPPPDSMAATRHAVS